MKLTLKDISKIKSASINLDGLTVIGGENNTGKSVVGRLLFAIIKALSRYESDFNEKKEYKIESKLDELYFIIRRLISSSKEAEILREEFSPSQFYDEILNLANVSDRDIKIQKFFEKKLNLFEDFKKFSKRDIAKGQELLSSLQKLVLIDENKDELVKNALNKALISEFYFELSPLKQNAISSVGLSDGGNTIFKVQIEKNKISNLSFEDGIYFNDATFIETPIVLSISELINYSDTLFELDTNKETRLFRLGRPKVSLHLKDIITKISDSKYYPTLFGNDLNYDNIISHIDNILKGLYQYDEINKDFVFRDKKNNSYKSLNTASGLKSFGILQLLLQSGFVDNRSLIIIDEPETYLHPKWQVEYAKLIVELVKNDLKILLTTHSPYMLQALSFYSKKEQLEDITSFYLSEAIGKQGESEFIDVTSDINKLFIKLAEPLNDLI